MADTTISFRRFSRNLKNLVRLESRFSRYEKEIRKISRKPAELRQFLEDGRDLVSNYNSRLFWGMVDTPRDLLELRFRADFFRYFGSFQDALEARGRYLQRLEEFSGSARGVWFRKNLRKIAIEQLRVSALAVPIWTQRRFDSSFAEVIRGKNVLLVGPGFELNGFDIGDFDAIAGPKLGVGNWLDATLLKSHRAVLVSYFNGASIASINHESTGLRKVWDVARVKTNEDLVRLRGLLSHQRTSLDLRSGVARSPEPLMVSDYGPLLGPIMVFDLLMARPASLTLSGFSFYLPNQTVHPAGYFTKASDISLLENSIRRHEPFSNFLFFKNLWEFGHIRADSITASILSLSAQQYAMALDQKFGQ